MALLAGFEAATKDLDYDILLTAANPHSIFPG
jgi:hypothetical protein